MQNHMKKNLVLLMLGCWVACGALVIAQDPAPSPIPYGFSDKPRDCEINLIRMEELNKHANADRNQDNVVIAIARLGDGEYAQKLNLRRLQNVLTLLTDKLGMKKGRVVIA